MGMNYFKCVYCGADVMWISQTFYVNGEKINRIIFREQIETREACSSCVFSVENTRCVLVEKKCKFITKTMLEKISLATHRFATNNIIDNT